MSGQVTITQLPLAQALTGTESVPIVQNGVTVQTTTGAISGAGALNYPFLTVGTAAGLTEARYLSADGGLELTDGGVGNALTISMTGAASSLNTAGLGLLVKNGADTVSNVSINVGTGMTISNANGVAGNPTLGLNANLQSLAIVSGQGIMAVNGSLFGPVTLTGVTSQTSITNGNAVGGNPTVGLASNAVFPGTGGVQVPTGTTVQRLANNGVVRYNSQTTRFEGYQNGSWVNFGNGDGTVTSVTGTVNQIAVANSTTTPIISIVSNPTLPGNSYVQLPSGTTAQRGLPIYGALRYNTESGGLEAYTQATGWGAIISGSGVATFSGGFTGLTPSTPMSGGIVLGGILNGASGGTGVDNGAYTITLGGDVSIAGDLTFSGAYPVTVTSSGATSITLPTTGTLATLDGVETLTNKTLVAPNLGTPTAVTLTYATGLPLTTGVTGVLPVLNGGTGVTTSTGSGSNVLNNGPTLIAPVMSSIVNTGTLTLPTSTDTLVARNTTDTLTNKSISGLTNTFTNIPNSGLTNPSTTIGTTVATLGATTLVLDGLTHVAVTQDPTSALQLATKQYVDSVAQGLSAKAACVYTTTANITLAGLTTQVGGDWPGVLTTGQRILVKNQTLSQYNGIYIADALTWTRSTDMDVWSEVPGAFVFVQSGSTLAATGWTTTAMAGGTIDVTPMPWVQFSGAGTYTAGTGLTLSGTQFSITNTAVTAGSYGSASKTLTATVNAQGQLTALSATDISINASQITAGTLPVARGGTGITSLVTNYIPYGNGTSPLGSSASLQFDGTTLRVGAASPLGGTTNPIAAFTGSSANYVQSYVYNSTNGTASSGDFVAYASNSTDAHGWSDMGFTGPTFADPTYTVTGANEAYLFGSAPTASGATGNLVYATDSTGTDNAHQWYVGGFTQLKSAWKMQLTSTGLTTSGSVTALGGIAGGAF